MQHSTVPTRLTGPSQTTRMCGCSEGGTCTKTSSARTNTSNTTSSVICRTNWVSACYQSPTNVFLLFIMLPLDSLIRSKKWKMHLVCFSFFYQIPNYTKYIYKNAFGCIWGTFFSLDFLSCWTFQPISNQIYQI